MAALKNRGFSVQPFKVGPDFIDPGYHSQICGNKSRNLDGWMLSRKYNLDTFITHTTGKDFSVIEGVMGLYDGCSGKDEDGSTAQIAKWCKSPVILVVDAKSMARSAGALVYGFEKYDRGINLAGVILNRVGSTTHYRMLKDAIRKKCTSRVLGYLPQEASIKIPERHLGLITSNENSLKGGFIKKLSTLIEDTVDVDGIIKIAKPVAEKKPDTIYRSSFFGSAKKIAKVGVAYDEAFCFYYQDNLDILEQCGGEIIFFSPLRDDALPKDLDGIYFGGGYPELYAAQLEANRTMRDDVRSFALRRGAIYAECGGLIYLAKNVSDLDHKKFTMVGVFPFTATMQKKLNRLGYFTVKAVKNNIFSPRGGVFKGHQFRYSSVRNIPPTLNRVYNVTKNNGGSEREGFFYKNVLASYVHVHFGSNINCARHFLESCRS
jgi:cobyrinic acid a,c-diamide synthase